MFSIESDQETPLILLKKNSKIWIFKKKNLNYTCATCILCRIQKHRHVEVSIRTMLISPMMIFITLEKGEAEEGTW